MLQIVPRRLSNSQVLITYFPCLPIQQPKSTPHGELCFILFISAGAAAAPSTWCTPGREGGWWRRRSENISQNPRTAAPARAALRGYQQLINWGFQQTYIQPESTQSKEYAPGIWYMGEDINGIAIFDTQYSYCYIIAKNQVYFTMAYFPGFVT